MLQHPTAAPQQVNPVLPDRAQQLHFLFAPILILDILIGLKWKKEAEETPMLMIQRQLVKYAKNAYERISRWRRLGHLQSQKLQFLHSIMQTSILWTPRAEALFKRPSFAIFDLRWSSTDLRLNIKISLCEIVPFWFSLRMIPSKVLLLNPDYFSFSLVYPKSAKERNN